MRPTTLLASTLLPFACSPPAGLEPPEPGFVELECPGPAIHTLQGAGHRSPFAGLSVDGVCGVVTAVRERHLFLQEPEQEWDGDSATSEALVVSVDDASGFEVGERVIVSGVVSEERASEEELTVTALAARSIAVLDRVGLPRAVVLGEGGRSPPGESVADTPLSFEPSLDALDFYESLEAMRVEIDSPVAVSASIAGYAEVVMPSGTAAQSRTRGGGLYAREGDPNPERIRVRHPALPSFGVGATLPGVSSGVLGYADGAFQLELDRNAAVSAWQRPAPVRSSLSGSSERVLVATYNVQNLGPSAADRGARIARELATTLDAPDIVALQEIQDDNGPSRGALGARKVLTRLAEAVVAAGGPEYGFAEAPPEEEDADGGQPGANIRVAYLFRKDRVALVSVARFMPEHEAWRNSRKPLVGDFCALGRRVRLVNVHLVSRLGDDPLFGVWQPPRAPSVRSRFRQVELLAALAERELGEDREAQLVVLGDFNDEDFGDAVRRLESAGLENLVARLDPADRYTYNYRGNSVALDHILVSPALAEEATVAVLHLNADLPAAERSSDHDPVAALLSPRGARCEP